MVQVPHNGPIQVRAVAIF